MGRKGFTLVEVLIVVIIIGILASIGIPQFAVSIEKAKSGEARASLGHIQTGEKIYFAENEAYHLFNETNASSIAISELDITLTQKYWLFKTEVDSEGGTGYIATATRKGTGAYAGQTITMDYMGTIGGDWQYLTD